MDVYVAVFTIELSLSPRNKSINLSHEIPPQEGDEEVKELLQKFKVMTGLSSDDPPDSQWITLEKTDRKTGRKVPVHFVGV